jgi:hypothetical protein
MTCPNAASMLDEALQYILDQTWRDLSLGLVERMDWRAAA